jgi:hypothetical protein
MDSGVSEKDMAYSTDGDLNFAFSMEIFWKVRRSWYSIYGSP